MLELQGISAGYGAHQVLRDVSLAVPTGKLVALLGANGAGKTTLLRVASGLLRPTAGHMTLDGVDVTGARPHQLATRGVCHVPEGRGIFPSLTVRENLSLQAGQGKGGLDRAVDAFPRLGERLTQTAGTMSGGEQQMLALADYVYLLNRGQVAYRGEPSELEDEDVFARYLGTEVGAAH